MNTIITVDYGRRGKIMFSDVTSHLVYQVINTPIREYPYPHFFNTNVFPQNFYAEIMKHMPKANNYETLKEQGLINISDDELKKFERRGVITLHDDKIQLIDEGIRDFWLELVKILMSPNFLIPLFVKFRPWIIDEHGELLEIPYTTEISLFRDTEMWELDPHTDQRNEILGLFLYLPPDDSTSHLGTCVYTPKEPGLAAEGANRFPRKFFNCAYTAPFLPNCVFGFFRNNTAFHGVDYMKKTGDVRNLMTIQVIKK